MRAFLNNNIKFSPSSRGWLTACVMALGLAGAADVAAETPSPSSQTKTATVQQKPVATKTTAAKTTVTKTAVITKTSTVKTAAVKPAVTKVSSAKSTAKVKPKTAATKPKVIVKSKVVAKSKVTAKSTKSAAKPKTVARSTTAAKSKPPVKRAVTAKRKVVATKHKPVAKRKLVAVQSKPRKPAVENKSSSMIGKLALQSRAALVMNAETGEVLYGKNMSETVPIASITKLMTAMIVLDAQQDMNEVLTVTTADIDTLRHSHSRLTVGSKLPRNEMMLLALMASENRAASALARNYPGGFNEAIKAMNRKAASLGMTQSRFFDGTGLNGGNKAALMDLAKLVKAANAYPQIHKYSTTSSHMVAVSGQRKQIKYVNTNPLVNSDSWNIGVTKTGYIKESGMCLVMQARIAATNTLIVLMDSWGKYSRVGDANRVRKWMESSVRLASNQRL